jgi:hypothetical protein
MIKIKDNESFEMMEISKDGQCIFYGNYWDFGYQPNKIKNFLEELGLEVELSNDLKVKE